MLFKRVISVAAFSMTVLASVSLQAATNNGQPESALRTSPAAAKAVNPFKGDCAAFTKARFAATYNSSVACAFEGNIGPSKNLQDFTSPGTGVYCFLPSKAAGLTKPEKLAASYPSVQIEWGSSSGSLLLAYVLRTAFECPAGYIEVRTYDFSGGPATLSGSVAFYLKVE